MYVYKWSQRATPGNAIKVIGFGHVAWGLIAYRKPLRELLDSGPLDSVGDGVFSREHSEDGRAAGFWFLLAAPLIVLCGHLIGAAEQAGDRRALRASGRTVFGIGVVGTAMIPRSGFLAVFPIGYWLLRRNRRAADQ